MCQHAVRSYDLCCGAIFQASGSCRSPTPPSIHRSTHIHKHMVSSCFLSRSSPNSPAQSATSAPKPALTRKQNQNCRWPTSLRLPPVCPLSFFVRVPNLYIVLYCSFCLRFILSNFLSTLTLSFSTLYLSFCVGCWTRARVQGPEWEEFKQEKQKQSLLCG